MLYAFTHDGFSVGEKIEKNRLVEFYSHVWCNHTEWNRSVERRRAKNTERKNRVQWCGCGSITFMLCYTFRWKNVLQTRQTTSFVAIAKILGPQNVDFHTSRLNK